MRLNDLKDKKILILGFGREGQDTLKFLKRLFPKKKIAVADAKFDKNYLRAVKDYDVIIKSPGIPIHLPEVKRAFKKRKITSQTEIFLQNCPGKIIGITGTKGKGTTASLIYKILKEGKFRAHLIGNIEKPALNLLLSATPKDVYVYEMSSHQLYNLKKSPQIALLLNISPAHLDYYKSFKEYIQTKANITLYQTKNDYLIFNPRDKIVKGIARRSKAQKIKIPANYKYLTNTSVPLVGRFNLQNIMAAVTVGKLFKVPKEDIVRAIKKFKPLPYRLEYVGNFKGIKFYDDSAATVPEASCQAIIALGDDIQTLILGGHKSDVDYQNLAEEILKRKKIKNLIFFPPSGKIIWQTIQRTQGKQLRNYFFVDNMGKAVKLAYLHTEKEKIVLLSPACPSFGVFNNYKQRGNLFKKWVKKYARR